MVEDPSKIAVGGETGGKCAVPVAMITVAGVAISENRVVVIRVEERSQKRVSTIDSCIEKTNARSIMRRRNDAIGGLDGDFLLLFGVEISPFEARRSGTSELRKTVQQRHGCFKLGTRVALPMTTTLSGSFNTPGLSRTSNRSAKNLKAARLSRPASNQNSHQ
jgi:hypothetical protein